MKNHSPRTIGALQALGLVAYVGAFAFLAPRVVLWFDARMPEPQTPSLPIMLFLLTFVTSALICATIEFAYPVQLFMQDRRKEALQVVLWSLGWLLALGALVASIVFSIL